MLNPQFPQIQYINHRYGTVVSTMLELVQHNVTIVLSTCSADGRLGFVDSQGSIAHIIKKAHYDEHIKKSRSINRVLFIDDQTLVSGDDDGGIKVWDLRTTSSIFEANEQPGTISAIHYDEQHHNIITSCQDGTIAIYDLKQGTQSENKLYAMSDSVDEELFGLTLLKNGKYIACPSSQGSIVIFDRNNVQQYCDRIKGLPGSVSSIVKVDEHTVIAGSQDGFARGVSMHPNKILQVIGQHEEQQNYGIQFMAISHCQRILASTSHDASIKFYDVSQFIQKRKGNTQHQKWEYQDQQIQNKQAIESDLSSSESSVSQEEQSKPKRTKVNLRMRQNQLKQNKKKEFFKGL